MLALLANRPSKATEPVPSSAVLVDRIAAVVGDEILLESDVDRFVAVGLEPKRAGESKEERRERVLDDLIVGLLRERELRKTGGYEPDPAVVRARVKALEDRLRGETGETLDAVLSRARVTRAEVTDWIRRGIALETFIRERLEPAIETPEEDLKAYFETEFKANWQATGQERMPSFSEVQDEIRKLLHQRRLNDAIERWTRELRGKTRTVIYRRGGPAPTPQAP